MARQQSVMRRRSERTLRPSSLPSLALLLLFVVLILSRGTLATSSSAGGNARRVIGAEGLERRADGVYECTTTLTTWRTATMAATNVIGTPAPPITLTGNFARPYGVENDTFADLASAKQRSCSDQFNTCQMIANDDTAAGFTLSECEDQQNTCLNNDAVQVSSSSTLITTEQTTTISTTTSITTSIPPPSTSSTSSLSTATTTSATVFTSTSFSTSSSSSSTSSSTTTAALSSMLTATTTIAASEAAPLTTSDPVSSSTAQPSVAQQTTITQGQYILICDL